MHTNIIYLKPLFRFKSSLPLIDPLLLYFTVTFTHYLWSRVPPPFLLCHLITLMYSRPTRRFPAPGPDRESSLRSPPDLDFLPSAVLHLTLTFKSLVNNRTLSPWCMPSRLDSWAHPCDKFRSLSFVWLSFQASHDLYLGSLTTSH